MLYLVIPKAYISNRFLNKCVNDTYLSLFQELSAGAKYHMSYQNEVAKLEILDSSEADAGDYEILAKNKVGQIESQARLTVHSECDF